MDGNKDEAEKCFQFSQKFYDQGNYEKALKFLVKARKLYPNDEYNGFEAKLMRKFSSSNQNAASNKPPQESANTTRQRNNVPAEDSPPPNFTALQLSFVKKIMKCKDHYEILGVSKEATDSDIKKAYKKLALQLHPDKCKAPGADEAFKAVGNAMSVLTDPEKRKTYDLFGPEDRHLRSSSAYYETRSRSGNAYEREAAEELLNMFFGAGGGHPSDSFWSFNNRRFDSDSQRRRTTHAHHQESSSSVLMQLMPLILLLLFSIFSSFFTTDPVFSLQPTSKYTEHHLTSKLRIPYYVKTDFATEFTGSLRRLESQVEEEYIHSLRSNCYKERNHRENMLWRARSFGDADLFRKANQMKSPSCDMLNQFYA